MDIWIQKQRVNNVRANFVPADDEGHLTAPRVDEAGPAGVQGDVVAILTPEPDG